MTENRGPPAGGVRTSTTPGNVKKLGNEGDGSVPTESTFRQKLYNRETKEYCGRTCDSWVKIVSYGIIYLVFLTTYTLIVLYITLLMIQQSTTFHPLKPTSLIYPLSGIGLTAIPTSENTVPLIWYRKEEKKDFAKYINAIDRLLRENSRGRTNSNLGPCGLAPYGYGDSPCVIIKVNKQFYWSGKPLTMNSINTSIVPPDVVDWMMTDSTKLWVECSGYHSYDKEHMPRIKYFPDPPGIAANVFPQNSSSPPPLIAIQISNFTVGISLAIECRLWYESGPSVVNFVLYVAPNDSIAFTGQTYFND